MKKLITLLISITLASCNPVNLPPDTITKQTEVKTYTEGTKEITVNAGIEFIIKLESNITTGFKWDLSNVPDPGIIQKISSEYINPVNQMPGTGSYELWKFKAIKKGNTDIKMKYFRSWEKDVPPAKEISILVKIN